MADLSAAAHPRSGYLPGHVLGDSQAVPMFACDVCTMSMNVVSLFLFSWSFLFRLIEGPQKDRAPSLAPYTLH